MVETDFSGNFANSENCKENDLIEILEEGSYEDKQSTKGIKYRTLNIPIKNGSKDLIYSPSTETGKRFQASWGRDSKDWKGKKATVKHVLKSAFGTTKTYIELFPIEEKKV